MKSGFEEKLAQQLKDANVKFGYETLKIPYEIKKSYNYIPDLILENGIIIEAKGYFRIDAIYKMKKVKEQNPNLDIRFVFYNAKKKIRKNSKMTYGDWADKYKFPWAEHNIPTEWLK